MMSPIRRWVAWVILSLASTQAATVDLHTRSRVPSTQDTNQFSIVDKTVRWDFSRTAVVVCDMWDKHHCPDATERVGELVPHMNEVIKAARKRGALIIHCPSDTMDFYKEHPGRKLAQSAPKVETKVPLEGWCSLKGSKEPPLPIDDSDGGCDGCPECPSFRAWSRQHPGIEIAEGDAITDSAEAYYLMRQRGLTNVLVMGVHENMCVLGRPFAIRQMVAQGQNVLLMRDMTDTMYNHRRRPFVSHFVGTDLVCEHIEKYWCASITSSDLLGGPAFRFKEDRRKEVCFIIGENEYSTWETLPAFARQELDGRGYRSTWVVAPTKEGDPHFENWEAIRKADLLVLSIRRRTPPMAMMEAIRAHLNQGKPLVGIRTASHAFDAQPSAPDFANWPGFDDEILGADYQGHYGNKPPKDPPTRVTLIPETAGSPLLVGVDPEFTSTSHLYKYRKLFRTVTPLLHGRVADGRGETEPVAWLNSRDNRRVFYTSLGNSEDFINPNFRRLLLNGILWSMDEFIPPATPRPIDYASTWQTLKVPGTWEANSQGRLEAYDGFAWYRCWAKVPSDWAGRPAELVVESIDNAHEAYVNGKKVGAAGNLPPQYENGLEQKRRYDVGSATLRPGEWNLIALRIYDKDGKGGFKGAAPVLISGPKAMRFAGDWQFRTGDNPEWAQLDASHPD